MKSWKSRWFVLTDNCLYYFRTEKDPQPLGIMYETYALAFVYSVR